MLEYIINEIILRSASIVCNYNNTNNLQEIISWWNKDIKRKENKKIWKKRK